MPRGQGDGVALRPVTGAEVQSTSWCPRLSYTKRIEKESRVPSTRAPAAPLKYLIGPN